MGFRLVIELSWLAWTGVFCEGVIKATGTKSVAHALDNGAADYVSEELGSREGR